jgi:hypothetical protein
LQEIALISIAATIVDTLTMDIVIALRVIIKINHNVGGHRDKEMIPIVSVSAIVVVVHWMKVA